MLLGFRACSWRRWRLRRFRDYSIGRRLWAIAFGLSGHRWTRSGLRPKAHGKGSKCRQGFRCPGLLARLLPGPLGQGQPLTKAARDEFPITQRRKAEKPRLRSSTLHYARI
jgi:hypothetical protein